MTKQLSENLYILDHTPAGGELIAGNEAIRSALALYVTTEEPFKARVPDSRLLGAGRYGYAFKVGGIVIKISSPTSSQDAFDSKEPFLPEDLSRQFNVMKALKLHLDEQADTITAPEQLFVAHTPGNAFILGQEYMADWVPLEQRTSEIYGHPLTVSALQKQEIADTVVGIRERLFMCLEGFAMKNDVNDLGLHKDLGVHGGNILVPQDSELSTAMPLCIIDQPQQLRIG